MESTSFPTRLQSPTAKMPILLVRKAPRFPIGALFVILVASVIAAASAQAVTFTGAGAVNFGSKTTPAPCSKTLTLSYSVTASGTLGSPQALTTGAPHLDYKLASGTTCIGSVIKGNTCTVNVTFAPGARNGAVEVVDASGNVLATTYIYGIGNGPLAGFNPPAALTLGTGYNTPFIAPLGIAVDGSGNVFIVDDPNIKELLAVDGSLPANPTVRGINPGPDGSYALAIAGAGNLLMALLKVFRQAAMSKPGTLAA